MILSSKARWAGAGLVALSLAGCGVTPVAPNVDTPGMPNAEVALQKSMDDTAREMARIGAIEPSGAVASKPTVVAGGPGYDAVRREVNDPLAPTCQA